jgi:opacity protein-like surface antigen
MDLVAAPSAQAGGFIEGAVGVGMIQPVSTDTQTVVSPPDTVQLRGTLHYNDSLSAGAEAGWRNVDATRIKISLSYDYLKAKLSHADVSGTIDAAPFAGSMSSGLLRSFGIDFDNTVHLAAANIYFEPEAMNFFQPYIGVGVGAAFFDHAGTEPAVTATIGVTHALTPNAYIGLRYRYAHVWGPTDDLGFKYDPINAHLISAIVGVNLN